MSIRQYTFEFYPEDCIGNDAGKHNYNALSLETKICNLSSEFFSSGGGFQQALNTFLSKVDSLVNFGDLTRYNSASTAVKTLSSYWAKHEFSVLYPVNISYHGSDPILNPTQTYSLQALVSLARGYLLSNFPPANYATGTRVHVNMFLYTQASNPKDPNNLVFQKVSNEYSFLVREMSVELSRKDVHFKTGTILTFLQTDSNWLHINSIGPSVDLEPAAGSRKQVLLTLNKSVVNYDVGENAKKSSAYSRGKTDVILTVKPGVEITSDSAESPALLVGNLNNGDTVVLFNYGNILGAGGRGGDGGNSPSSGSTNGNDGGIGGIAIGAFMPMVIENHGNIYGGGGGGAGGTGGLGGSKNTGGGGGGGAGKTPGTGGYRGTNPILSSRGIVKSDAETGGYSKGGQGGPGISNNIKAIGGSGGDIGHKGEDSDSAKGGNPGYYIMGNSNVYWAVTGNVLGGVI
jgi:hypothetical protein